MLDLHPRFEPGGAVRRLGRAAGLGCRCHVSAAAHVVAAPAIVNRAPPRSPIPPLFWTGGGEVGSGGTMGRRPAGGDLRGRAGGALVVQLFGAEAAPAPVSRSRRAVRRVIGRPGPADVRAALL